MLCFLSSKLSPLCYLFVCCKSTRAMILIHLILGIVTLETYAQMGCEWGKYGENCNKVCPNTCMPDSNRKLIHCQKETGMCSEGCIHGWFDDLCDRACSTNCLNKVCNRQNGICTFGCSGNYRGDFCNTPVATAKTTTEVTTHMTKAIPSTSTPKETTNLAAIMVPVFLILAVVILVVVFIWFVRRKLKRGEEIRILDTVTSRIQCLKRTDAAARSCEEEPLTAQGNETHVHKLEMEKKGEAGIDASEKDDDSLCSFELLDDDNLPPGELGHRIKDIQKVFVESVSFKKAKERLDTFGHVTITGGPGHGKTSTALMLGAEYMKQGYDLVLTEDHDKVRLNDYLHIGKDVCIIFDDIFKTVRSHKDLSGIKHFLYDLSVYLGQSESRSERRYVCLQQISREEPSEIGQPHICVIFAAENNNLEYVFSKLRRQGIFNRSAYVPLHYTQEEKRELWLKYKGLNETFDDLDVDKLTALEDTTVGFPLACKLFSSCAVFQMHREHFFEKPSFYITNHLRTTISSLDEKSAALTLMVLCEGQLDIRELETGGPGQQKDAAVSVDSQQMDKDVSVNSQLKLKGKRTDSILIPVDDSLDNKQKPKDSTDKHQEPKDEGIDSQQKPRDESTDRYQEPKDEGDESTDRYQEPKDEGNDSQKNKPKDESTDSHQKPKDESTVSHQKPKDECKAIQQKSKEKSTDNQVKPGGARLDSLLQTDDDNPDLEARLQAVTALVKTSNRQAVAKALRGFCGTFLTEGNITTFAHNLIYDVCVSMIFNIEPEFVLKHCSVRLLLDYIQEKQADPIPVSEHKLTIPFSKANGAILADRMADSFSRGALTTYIWHPIWTHTFLANSFIKLLRKDHLSEDVKHHILNYACVTGNACILAQVVSHCNINRHGLNGWTPLMFAVVFEYMDCFDILVKEGADLTLCDDNNYNILHLACLHGDVPTVKHVKTFLKKHVLDWYTNQFLNVQARTGWTPVMCAVVFGTEGVSDCFIHPKKKTDRVKTKLKNKKIDFGLRDSNNNTLLHLACQSGSKTTVEKLLPDIDINTRGSNGQTPIMCAVLSERKDIFDLLVTKGADLTLTDDNNNSLLHMACSVHDVAMLVNIKSKLDVNIQGKHDINIQGKHGWTPVMRAAVNGYKDAFEHLLDPRKSGRQTEDRENNLLHLACHGGNISIVKHLLPMFDINGRGNNGWTPVMFAAVNDAKRVFDLLVSEGADIRLRDNSNNSVLHLACIGGSVSIVNYLLSKMDINCLGNKGRTAIMVTALHARPIMFELLLAKKAVIRSTDDNKDTILHLACEGGNCSIVTYLAQKFDINVSGRYGRTPVMAAALAGMKEVFVLLVSQKVDLTLTDDYRDNVLHMACQGGNTAIVEYIVTNLNAKGQEEFVDQHPPRERQGDSVTIVNEVNVGFDINTRGRDDQTPLMRTVCGGHLDVYKFLVSHNADRTLVDKDGQTLLHLASRHGQLSVIEHIIDSVDINSTDNAGLTPVMTSVTCDKVSVFDFLRRKGADLSLVDNARNDVLHLAKKRDNKQIIELLGQTKTKKTNIWS